MKIELQLKKTIIPLLAIITVVTVGSVQADFTADCIYDGYVAMGGMVTNTTNSYLLPGNPDSAPQDTMETFGYAFLKFDSADLPGSTVSQAFLQLDVMALQDGMSYPVSGTANLGVFAVSSDVTGISAGTADTFRDYISDVASDSLSITDAELGQITLNITDIVNEWITSGSNYGLVLTTPGGVMPRIYSSEATSGTAPVITSVPEPTTMALLTCGVAGIFARCRKRRQG